MKRYKSWDRMKKVCKDCGKPCDIRSISCLCKRCSGRRLGKIYGGRNPIPYPLGRLDLELNWLPPNIAPYIAGLVDADGHIGITVSIASKYTDYIIGIQGLIGGKLTPGNNASWQLVLRKQERDYILPQIIPYMILKKEKAIALYEKDLQAYDKEEGI